MVNEGHLSPCHMGPLPNQLAALNRRQIEVHQLTVDAALTRKKEYIYQAAMLDPHAGSELTIDEIRTLWTTSYRPTATGCRSIIK